ncbi:class I SAM-dependent methyltransferase [bacterium]|jgi:SAM-dependent methyltransferase|nr:class I SAM-dependent methyltransferase [bacterium]NBS52241.1 class I SAM-dependent methyltransferase [Spartobacteria bacterium]
MATSFSNKQLAQAYTRSKWLQGYIAGKLAWDPVFKTAWKIIINRGKPVLDIGCGLGLLGISMRAAGIPFPYRGADPSIWKINKALETMRYYGFEEVAFEVNDALNTPIPPGATVFLVDVLHYLKPAEQRKMLERLADAADAGSLVLIRTAFKGVGLRYALTLLQEFWTRISGWIRGGAINFPVRRELLGYFKNRGLKVMVTPLWGNTPFASELIVIEPVETSEP